MDFDKISVINVDFTATEPADFVFPVLPVIPFMNLRQLLSADEAGQQAGQ